MWSVQQFIATGRHTVTRRQETLDLLSCAPWLCTSQREVITQVVGSPMKTSVVCQYACLCMMAHRMIKPWSYFVTLVLIISALVNSNLENIKNALNSQLNYYHYYYKFKQNKTDIKMTKCQWENDKMSREKWQNVKGKMTKCQGENDKMSTGKWQNVKGKLKKCPRKKCWN